jgi:CheY-like chemotaxis protein
MDSMFEGKRILIAEDDASLRMMMANMLLEMGFAEVSEAQSLAGTIMLAKDHPPDVALLDIDLTDGLSVPLADNLAALNIPCVFMSSISPDAEYARWNRLEVLTKPFAPATLQVALQRAMGRTPGKGEA